MKVKLLQALFLFLIVCVSTLAWAQDYACHNWYFGNKVIRFSRSANTATLSNNSINLNGASAVATDPTNGNLLFYTDGQNVYNVGHAVMEGGTGLNADANDNQSVVVAQVPGQPFQYYIITKSSTGAVSYSLVDMSLQENGQQAGAPPLGVVVSTNTPIAGLANQSEAMITIPHDNGTDFWLITHESGTTNYHVTLFTSAGPQPTTVIPSGLIQQAANFAYNEATGQIAVAPKETNRNVEIITFDNATGMFTASVAVPNSGVPTLVNGQAIYDVEWSANGQYLYVSAGDDVIQFDLLNPSSAPLSVLPNSIFQSYGLQMGADSAIYHLYQATNGGPILLGKITDTDTVATAVNYVAEAFPGNSFTSTQFSSCAPDTNITISVSFNSVGGCANSPVSFFPTVTPPVDSLVWDFGDGTTSTGWSPVHTYAESGQMTVTVTAYLNGQSQTATQVIDIANFDIQITLVQDTTACSCELPYPKAKNPPPAAPNNPCNMFELTAEVQGSGTPSLQWYGPAGAMGTTTTLKPDSAGYYYLVATVGNCQAYAGVNIKEYLVQDQRANIWYFGQNAGIDFNPVFRDPDNPQPPAPISSPMNTPEGTSTISDRNGQVIFYTDGSTVWNSDHQVIATNIGGDPNSAQSAIIIPVPGDETLYYIFTTQEIYGTGTYELRYTLFDLKLNNGSGGVVDPDGDPATPASTVLFTKSTERITSNGNWLIAHEYGNNSFRAYQVTPQGIVGPVISSVGSEHSITAPENGQGYMVIGPQGQIVVALNNTIEIFDFNNSTGEVSNPRTVNAQAAGGQVYGIGFSPGGTKLYTTVLGSTEIHEFAYDSLTSTYVHINSFDVGAQPGAIQNGPDGQTYVAVAGSSFLTTISPIEDTIHEDGTPTQPSVFTVEGFELAPGTTSTLGLPNFIQTLGQPNETPSLRTSDGCVDTESEFSASGRDSNIDKFDWTILNAQGLQEASYPNGGSQISHTFTEPGVRTIRVRVYNKCGLDITMEEVIEIHPTPPLPPMLAAGELNAICNDQPKTLIGGANDPELSYEWSTGETSPQIIVTVPNRYSVTVTNTRTGCTNENTVDIYPYFNGFELGPDQIVCENSAEQITVNIQLPGISFQWFVNDVSNGNTTNAQQVNTSVPGGPTKYSVRISDQFCFATDAVNYTVNPTPVFTATGNDAPVCNVNGGSIDLNITYPAGRPLSYFIGGPSSAFASNVSVGAYNIPSLFAGVYTASVSDQVSGCSRQHFVTINNPGITVTALQDGTCDPDIALNITTSVVAGTYNVINTNTGQTDIASTIPAPNNFLTRNDPNVTSNPLRAGNNGTTYIVQVIDASGCQASTDPPVTINQGPMYSVAFDTGNLCTQNSVTVNTTPGDATTFNWSDSNPIPSGSGATVVLTPGTWNLEVTASNPNVSTCPGTATLTVTVTEPLNAQFENTTACADQVTLSATPTGNNFLYRWNVNGALSPGGPTLLISPGTIPFSANYGVQIVNTLNGCFDDSDPRLVNVNGALNVSLTSTLPCEGSPFTLTATPSRAATTFQWKFNGNTIANQTSATHANTKSGTYAVIVTAPTNCETTAETTIVLAPVAPIDIGNLRKICPEPENPDPNTREAVLDAGPGFSSYEWLDVTNGGSQPLGVNTQTLVIDREGRYEVRALNSFGCASKDNTEIVVDCDPVIVGPNAFRPSSSIFGNQGFKLFTFFISDDDFQVFIFNRWGEMVYQSNDRKFFWNGGLDNNLGKLLPPGTYSYLVRYKSSYNPDQGVREKRGGVVLVR